MREIVSLMATRCASLFTRVRERSMISRSFAFVASVSRGVLK